MQHLILIAIALVLFPLFLPTLGGKKNSNMTLSKHIATNKFYKIFFASVVTISATLAGFSILGYIPQKINISIFYYIISAIILLGLLLLAWLPDTKGLSSKIHQISAWTMAHAMLPMIVYLYAIRPDMVLLVSIFIMLALQTRITLDKTGIMYTQVLYLFTFITNIVYFIYTV